MYEQYPAAFDKLKSEGQENLFALSKITYSIKQFREAIGSPNGGAVYHWIRGTTNGVRCEKRAKLYLEKLYNTPEQPALELVPPNPKFSTFMVKIPAEYLEKWTKLSKLVIEAGGDIEDF
jgi:hypothetical protein